MKKLGYTIPEWNIKKRLQMKVSTAKDGSKKLRMMGVDQNGGPYELWKKIDIDGLSGRTVQSFPTNTTKRQPFTVSIPKNPPKAIDVALTSFGFYKEPVLKLKIDFEALLADKEHEYMAVFNAKTCKWELVLIHNAEKDCIGAADFK